MSERLLVMVVFATVAFLTALLPASVIAVLAHDASFLALPVLAAVVGGLWSAILGRGVGRSSEFGYPRGLAVVVFSFICIATIFAATRPLPYAQSLLAFLIAGSGFMVFPGLLGGLLAVWFLRKFCHEPNNTVERDVPQAAGPSQ